MYQIQNKPLAHISDLEISDIITMCAGFFGTVMRKDLFSSFHYMLRQNYNFTRDGEIIDAVSKYVSANTQETIGRFSPALLSAILKMQNKEKFPTYENCKSSDDGRFGSEEKKKKYYKDLFLDCLYKDFYDFCNRIEPSRVHIWAYVCKKLVGCGIVTQKEYDTAFTTNTRRQSKQSNLKSIHENEYKTICLSKFKDLAMQGKHISEIIN